METPQTREPETNSYKGRFTLLLTIALMLILAALLIASRSGSETEYAANIVSEDEDTDMLAYVSGDNNLMLYNPRTRTATKLQDNVDNFLIAHDGRVAFSPLDDGDIYVVDPAVSNDSPINITQNADTGHRPVAWSPDGRYLAFSSQQDRRDQALYVWNGETTMNIMPENNPSADYRFSVDWSNTGQLAFTIWEGTSPEIYIWNGSRTFNLSKNLDFSTSRPSWSRDGQLVFTTFQDGDSGFYVWDGVSFVDGSPDANTFTLIHTDWYPTEARWTDEGYLMYARSSEYNDSGMTEIVLHDLSAQSIVNRFPALSLWNWLVDDNQMIISSSIASGLPANYLDVTNTKGQILLSEVITNFLWSEDGYLVYCRIDHHVGRTTFLSIWDGNETWDVWYSANGLIPMQWLSHQDTFYC